MLFCRRAEIEAVKAALVSVSYYDSNGIKVPAAVSPDQLEAIAMQAISAVPSASYGRYEIAWQEDCGAFSVEPDGELRNLIKSPKLG